MSTRCETCRRPAHAEGQPFASLEQLFDTYLAQSAPPPDGALVTYIGDQRYDQLVSQPAATGLELAFGDVASGETPASGKIDSSLGEAQYIAVPVSGGGESGTLGRRGPDRGRARPGRERGPDRDRRRDRRPAARLALHLARGRPRDRSPAGALADRTDDQRHRSLGSDPRARQRRDRRARPHLQQHARPARDRVRRPEGLPHRCRPRAAHADHGDPRASRDAGRLAARARGRDRGDPGRARAHEPLRRRPAAC